MNSLRKGSAFALVAAAATVGFDFSAMAGTSTNTSGPVQQGQNGGVNNPAVTISFSGQTALRTFDTSPSITELQPGTEIILHDGTSGAPVEYIAPNNSSTSVQLASPNFTAPDTNPGTPTSPSTANVQVASAIRLEWHEQGSIDGFYDLINDEVGYNQTSGPISVEAQRTPSSSNPTWINTNSFSAGGSTHGFTLDNSGSDNLANTYSTTVYNQATGVNLLGGQNRIQFSVGEYPTEAFSVTGTPSPNATAGSAGYGQGNPALRQASTLTGLGVGGTRQTFQSSSIANESTSIEDPQTDAAYASGPWNTAGANNISSTSIAGTAVTYSANPGTGLLRINKGDAQWLQTTGRLQNGALFNVVARTVDTGQRAVFALNTGVDPSWAVGSNDDGNSTSSANANAQHSIGSSLRFDGKTSGSEAEKTIAQGRMAVGALSVPEANAAAATAPVRALNVDFNDLTDPTVGGVTNDSDFIEANFNTIVSNNSSTRYQAVLISHYNTVKSPNATALNAELAALYGAGSNQSNTTSAQQQTAWAAVSSYDPTTAETDGTPSIPVSGIKGDTTGDVAAFISNIVNSVGTANAGLTAASANNPADGLIATGFLPAGLLDWTRVTDGGTITPVTLTTAQQNEQNAVNSNYGYLFTTDNSINPNSYASNNETIGSSATYGAGNASGTPAINGAIPITATDASGNPVANGVIAPGGNYLFGNFNQNGVRDFSAVEQSVNAALSLAQVDVVAHGGKDSIFTPDGGVTNSTIIPSLNNSGGTSGWVTTGTDTKGDLIVLGDYNGDGKFNGQDLYLLALGASLADSTSSNTLTATAANFSDALRNPNDVLRKNAALDYIQNYLNTTSYTAAAAFLKQTGAAVLSGATVPVGATDLGTQDPITGLEQYTYDPTGTNAFNKSDVNRDGTVDFNDAVLVDEYNGWSYENQTQSLAAIAPTPVTGVTEQISLVAVQQVDGESAIGAADVAVVNSALTGAGTTNWYGYNLQKTGPGTITWARTGGAVNVYSGASFEVSNGTVQVGGSIDPFSGTGATAGNHVALAVDHGAKVQFLPNAAHSEIAGLAIDSTSQVDLGNNQVIVDYTGSSSTADATIRQYLINGRNGGAWNGVGGINTSGSTGSGVDPGYALGYADGAEGVVSGITSGQIEVRYTLLGDALLNGSVTGNDFTILIGNLGKSFLPNGNPVGWDDGDFEYTGSVTGNDFTDLVGNLGKSATLGDVQVSGSVWAAVDAYAAANGITLTAEDSVPEPASAGFPLVAGVGMLARRRRFRKA
jgi:hypothetical protein